MIAPRTPRRQKRESDYWLEAAREAVNDDAVEWLRLCWVVAGMPLGVTNRARSRLVEMFEPDGAGCAYAWWTPDETEARLLAALFLHEMAKDDERAKRKSEAP